MIPAPTLLVEWRNRKNLSQHQAAEKLGIKQPQLWAYEHGKSKAKVELAIQIAKRTGGFVPVASWTYDKNDFSARKRRTGTDG